MAGNAKKDKGRQVRKPPAKRPARPGPSEAAPPAAGPPAAEARPRVSKKEQILSLKVNP